MQWTQSRIENVLKNWVLINANTDSYSNCFYKCADKSKIISLYNQKNHEIIYGRRGTGKTTLFKALHYYTNNGLSNNASVKCIYIDMENVVPDENELHSTDNKVVIVETYRKLLGDLVEQLLNFWAELDSINHYYDIEYTEEDINLISTKLEVLYNLVVYGKKTPNANNEIEEITESAEKLGENSLTADIEFNPTSRFSALTKFTFGKGEKKKKIKQVSIKRNFIYTLDIYSIKAAIDEVVFALKLDRLIICVDEFTRVDKGLDETIQPFIAQLLKDTFFRNPNITVKVSSLWNRTEMQKRQLNTSRIGIELGEDIKRGIDLDTMFFNNEYSSTFFKDMITNTCLLADEENRDNLSKDLDFKNYLINSLFSSEESFNMLICGSQGIPRVFANLLLSAIDKREENKKPKIDPQIVFECIVENFTRDVRRKLPYGSDTVCAFDDFVTDQKKRFIIISIDDYEKNRCDIDGLLDNNYMHQYPSEKVPRKMRNHYKVYLVHFGNYLEAIGIKEWRKKLSLSVDEEIMLYPPISEELVLDPIKYQLSLTSD